MFTTVLQRNFKNITSRETDTALTARLSYRRTLTMVAGHNRLCTKMHIVQYLFKAYVH